MNNSLLSEVEAFRNEASAICHVLSPELERDRKAKEAFDIVLKKLNDILSSHRYNCPYCNSDNTAVRETYYDMTCPGCYERM